MPDLLLEIGLEEVPARMIASAQEELGKRLSTMLSVERLINVAGSNTWTPHGGRLLDGVQICWTYSTPRRLAVLIKDVADRQEDLGDTITGPSVQIAYKDGAPTPAAHAFAKKSGVAIEELMISQTPKGEYISARVTRRGRTASEVIVDELPKILTQIYWAKNMYWRAGKPERFVRPVLWLVCLLGDIIVPLEFAGKTAGRLTYGHRILHGDTPITITSPTTYLKQLESAHVLADVELRRHKISKALDHVTRTVPGLRWREDHALVDAVTHLTEWPDVLLGTFEPAYLTLPEEVLVTVMRDHQKYFAVEDATGTLINYFLTVTNIALDETNTPIIKQGNERVLRARFNDARFFWDFDQKIKLEDRVKLLENVTFQKDLGSYADKAWRVREIAAKLSMAAIAKGAAIDGAAVNQSATLAKTDLTAELVKEFTELQGIIGGLYAHRQGLSATVADAIYDQYLPASADDRIPRRPEGCILGIADRFDTITQMFSIGMEPTGSKDPFALRRATNAVVKILAEGPLPLLLSEVFGAAFLNDGVVHKLKSFVAERVEFYLREGRGFSYDVVKAIMSSGYDDLQDAVSRAEAVSEARGGDDFLAVSASFKRIKNILAKDKFAAPSIDVWLRGVKQDDAESALGRKFAAIEGRYRTLQADGNYRDALQLMATLRREIDAFFDELMVNDPDPEIRERRTSLLGTIYFAFSTIADFSEIVTAA